MECVRPILVKGNFVPCGKCPNCLANQRQEWIFRLRSEFLGCKFGLFVTMTYDDEHYPPSGTSKRDVQLFLKRIRKALGSRSLRYYIVSEYGDHTYRGHYHGLFFFYDTEERKIVLNDSLFHTISDCWNNGFLKFGEIEEGSIVYCTKYCLKQSPTPSQYLKPFRLVSRSPGLGEWYINKYKDFHHDKLNLMRVTLPGVSSRMPRFFKTKIIKQFETFEVLKLVEDSYNQGLERNNKQYLAFLRLKGLEDSEDNWSKFVEHDRERKVRHAELVKKHTKKQLF